MILSDPVLHSETVAIILFASQGEQAQEIAHEFYRDLQEKTRELSIFPDSPPFWEIHASGAQSALDTRFELELLVKERCIDTSFISEADTLKTRTENGTETCLYDMYRLLDESYGARPGSMDISRKIMVLIVDPAEVGIFREDGLKDMDLSLLPVGSSLLFHLPGEGGTFQLRSIMMPRERDIIVSQRLVLAI